jgi:2-desacetyl-2-hydroxyethyl bacteriochlorophyllide A dehydrogenase
MKALVCMKPGTLTYVDLPSPVHQPHHAIVRIRKICICGTDLHAFEGTQPYFSYPRILGHELSGELVDVDFAPGFQKGDKVTFLPYLNCGTCVACRAGKTNCCVKLQVCGVHIDGGMADYYSIPTRLLVSSQGLSLTELAMVEPYAIGAHGIRRANIQSGEFVFVMGAGPIGLCAMEFARLCGAEIIVADTNPFRLNFCKTKWGISHVIHADDQDMIGQLMELTNGELPTVVIDASGNRKALNRGINYLAHGGRYILIGLQKDELVFSHPEFHKKESTLMSSRNATREDFDTVIYNMKNNLIHPLTLISNRVKFEEAAARFSEWLEPSGNTIKVIVDND